MNSATVALTVREPFPVSLLPRLNLVKPEPSPAPDPVKTAAFADRAQPLAVVVAYEDAGTRERAMAVCQGTIAQQWHGLDLDCTWWKFDFLHHPAIAKAAAEAAARADLIIYSVHAEKDLPTVVKAWIKQWLPKQTGKDGALIVLVEGGGDNNAVRAPALQYLQRIASEASMTFFVRFFKRSEELPGCSLETISERADAVTDVLSEILSYRGGFPHGGINE